MRFPLGFIAVEHRLGQFAAQHAVELPAQIGRVPDAHAPDLAAVAVDLLVDGEHVASGSGKEVLGHPAAAIAWLANTLAGFGTALEPGHLVLPGAMTTAPFVGAGQQVEARFGGLGQVSVTFL